MAFLYVTTDGTLIVPGAYTQVIVAPQNAGLGTAGVLMLVGEADAGNSYVDEGNTLYQNAYGPDQKADVVAKYQSGPIVDAYNLACAASADPQITSSFSRVIIAKTNQSVKASSPLLSLGKADGTFAGSTAGTAYGTLLATAAGAPGNMIISSVTAKSVEALPTTGNFLLASPSLATSVSFRVNGAAAFTTSLAQYATPTAMVTAINAAAPVATSVIATGGVTRGTIFGTTSITLTSDGGLACHITGTFVNLPQVGDILCIPNTSVFNTSYGADQGSYCVIAAVAGRVDLYKLIDATAATKTPPVTATVTAAPTDVLSYSPVNITLDAGNPIAGLGKSLEIADTATGTFSSLCFVAPAAGVVGGVPSAAGFNSTVAAPTLITPTSEYAAQINLVRQTDSVNQALTAGGDVILTMGYVGTTAQAVISGSTMTLTLVGGSSAGTYTLNMATYKTVAGLCSYLNTIVGLTASPALASKGSIAAVNLDDGTYNFATDKGVNTGRIKADGYFTAAAILGNASLVQIAPPGVATKLAGVPAPVSNAFLTGGSKGATAQADIQGALDALQVVRGNFLVPLFSDDSANDIANSLTDPASSYTIDGINAIAKSHCLQMSTLKKSKPRQAFLSKYSTFLNDKNASGNTAQPRCSFFFQSVVAPDANGNLTTFKPWAKAVLAAAMQAAGGYRDLTGKYINISGIVDPSGYNNQSDTNKEDALLAGLMPIVQEEDGGYTWVSDQTSYTADSNFFFNSTQAVYAGDVIAMTARKRMERAFKGQSLADVNATTGKVVLKAILDDLRDAKWIAPSSDAPKGYKEPIVNIKNGNTMVCSVEVKVSTGIKFIPISFLVTPISDSSN